jgi:isocitrate lyase
MTAATAAPPGDSAVNAVNAERRPQTSCWAGIERPYGQADVERLRGSVYVEHTLATLGARRLRELLVERDFVPTLGALTGGQAVQQVRAGLEAIYVSGWQVAADANLSGNTYPDQSLYPANSVPHVVRRINQALLRADQIEHAEARGRRRHWLAPIVADAEAGFGGPLNAYELMRAMIEAGAAGVHFEDQLASEKKCGHLGGKVLVPTSQFIRTLVAARLAADVMDVPTVLVARTDADSAKLLTSDIDERDHPFIANLRTPEGYYRVTGGLDMAVARATAYAPYADVLWMETARPDLDEARAFADGVHAKFPGKLLAYNCSPSFNWKKKLGAETIARFQRELGAMGYAFQFVTLAGFHALNLGMFDLARRYRTDGMQAYAELQEAEFAAEPYGYTATRHQREVGTGYFDDVMQVVSGGTSSTLALHGSTESAQFAAGA